MRRQLPVYSPLSARALAAGVAAAMRGGSHAARARVHDLLATRYGPRDVLLTDSGTSALRLAIAGACADAGRPVALPGYACYDVATAAAGAGAHPLLYDVDPATLSPAEASLRSLRDAKPAAVVIAHLYGYPVDVVAVREHIPDAIVIEDAAQGHGGALHDRPLGSFGSVSVLSFGRGKGLTGGGGGALLAHDEGGARILEHARRHTIEAGDGMGRLAVLAAQLVLGRPWLYGIPSSVPSLHLGETLYRAPTPPRHASDESLAVLGRTWRLAEREADVRERNACRLADALRRSGWLRAIEEVPGGKAGFLRLPALVEDARSLSRHLAAAARLGIVKGYPTTLADIPGGPWHRSTAGLPGAAALVRSLVTIPTHSLLTEKDIERIERFAALPMSDG